jgi:hypothetical protein
VRKHHRWSEESAEAVAADEAGGGMTAKRRKAFDAAKGRLRRRELFCVDIEDGVTSAPTLVGTGLNFVLQP